MAARHRFAPPLGSPPAGSGAFAYTEGVAVREILLLGDPRRYETSRPVGAAEVSSLGPVLDDLFDTIHDQSEDTFEHREDCMSFPELLVRLENPARCRMTYRDERFDTHTVELSEDYAEQHAHEVDHLDGVLATDRAVDRRSVVLRRARPPKPTALCGYLRPATG